MAVEGDITEFGTMSGKTAVISATATNYNNSIYANDIRRIKKYSISIVLKVFQRHVLILIRVHIMLKLGFGVNGHVWDLLKVILKKLYQDLFRQICSKIFYQILV
jgi:hypothetical protein